jgi:uncharacterized membrane protein YkgB
MSTSQIMCTNGSKKGDKPMTKIYCDKDDEKECFDNSYKYCNELGNSQKIIIGLTIFVSLIILAIINSIIARIPVLGSLGVLAINLVTLAVLSVIVFMIYTNIKIKQNK